MTLGAYIRNVDDAGFLLLRCVHSPGTTRVRLANEMVVALQAPKYKPNLKILLRYGHFRPIHEAVFWKLIILRVIYDALGKTGRSPKPTTQNCI